MESGVLIRLSLECGPAYMYFGDLLYICTYEHGGGDQGQGHVIFPTRITC